MLTDTSFHVRGYVWLGVWYAVFCFDQIYIKHTVETVKMDSNWYVSFALCKVQILM